MAFPFNEKTHTNHRKLLPQVLTLTWRSTWQTWCRRLVRWFGSWYIVILVFGKVRIIAYLTMVEMVTELVVFFGSRWWFKFISWRLHFFCDRGFCCWVAVGLAVKFTVFVFWVEAQLPWNFHVRKVSTVVQSTVGVSELMGIFMWQLPCFSIQGNDSDSFPQIF